MTTALALLYIPLISLLDWLRGKGKPEGTGTLKKLLLGGAMSLAMGLSGWALALGTVLCAIGFTHGWGTPLGAALGKHNNMQSINGYEKWQKGSWLRTHAVGAMAFRGFLSALYLVPLAFVSPWVLCMLIGLPVAFSVPTLCTNDWERYEQLRGFTIGCLCVFIGLI